MTPDEELYRDLFMAELWPVCHEAGFVPAGPTKGLCKSCGRPVEQRKKAGRPREYCRLCRPWRKAA